MPSLSHVDHRRQFGPDASLVLVGIRACGKRSLGFVAAAALRRRFITEDYYFKEVTGLSRHEYLRQLGSQEFQHRDIEVLKLMLDNHRCGCVIECGLGSFTRPVQDHLRLYSLTNPVVYLLRDMDCIQSLLGLEDQAFQPLREGDALHRTCSNFEFYNVEDRSSMSTRLEDHAIDRGSAAYSFKLKDAKEDFTRFVRFITGLETKFSGYDSPFALLGKPAENRPSTHAIFIRSSDLVGRNVNLAELESGGDAIELCVDCWDADMPRSLSKQVSLFRRTTRVPIMLSVDLSSIEAAENELSGASNGTPPRDLYRDILEQGLRLAVEYLVVDVKKNQALLEHLVRNRGVTKIIGHCLVEPSSGISWDDEQCFQTYLDAKNLGCQLVRILRVAMDRMDNPEVLNLVHKVLSLPGPPRVDLIAYNIGPLGRGSQVLNPVFSSVTHPAIERCPRRELDPQVTSRDAILAQFYMFMLDPLQFYIIGRDVAYSLSPQMHNAAFQHCGMKHTYSIAESTSLDILDHLSQDPNFGGANVVQPWREEISRKLTSKSRHAETIGAVNTVLPLRVGADGTMFPLDEQAKRRNQGGRVAGWFGENTDWLGIMTCISRNISPRNAISPLKTTGLVIGAGGMARAAIYAMLQLGCRKIYIYNRTLSRAERVAGHFNAWASSQVGSTAEVVRVLRSTSDEWPSDACPPCIIASCVPADPDGYQPPSDFTMPLQWLKSPTGGVVLEVRKFSCFFLSPNPACDCHLVSSDGT